MVKIKIEKNRDHTKLKELILYIADKFESRGHCGATLLNKMLFFSDFIAYAKYGQSITGEDYFKLENGPAPKYLLEARGELVEEGRAVIKFKSTIKGKLHILIALAEPNLNAFGPEQIAVADFVFDELKDETAGSVSGISHKFYGWQVAKTQEIIPYNSVFLREPVLAEPSKQVRTAVARLIELHGSRPSI
jgi:hypothetical protein